MGDLKQTPQFIIAMVTAPSQVEAGAIADLLIQHKLAACVSMFPVTSVYTWNEQVQRDQEWQLIIKTEQGKFSELSAQVQKAHNFEVPEIIALPIIDGSPPYLNWIADQIHTP